MQNWTLQRIEHARNTPGQTLMLFITDRCPVGCAHCSVDSKADSPCITDFQLFHGIVNDITNMPDIRLVGISGGEPFIEKQGLQYAVNAFKSAKKDICIYTSGVWAKNKQVPKWVFNVLQHTSTIVLSTDAYHQAHIDQDALIHAIQVLVQNKVWLIVQGFDAEALAHLLLKALGDNWANHAEISCIRPLSNGRGAVLFTPRKTFTTEAFGPCPLTVNPTVRYDGRVSACCNESVIMGQGPERLRRQVTAQNNLLDVVHNIASDPLRQWIADSGLATLTQWPKLQHLQNERYRDACDLCWTVHAHFSDRPKKATTQQACDIISINPSH